ncbi:MarR family transcriptional regulator [Streptomyces sp. NPDC002588]|uniref:MarR family transcriptional regulator n=1 Tax=Streptomyces sp. NPDC002588 TaxID=3154419 RepID=UPI0033171196
MAAYIGARTDSVRSYRKHGLLPPPDVVEGGKPYWLADTVQTWLARSRHQPPPL